ncbi:MAG: hypothetical protein CMJ83_16445 [Planctomycetes bacterium]|nr:hypothetical protein [Planctomycetota bacterium]
MDVVLVKWGGSLITDKTRPRRARHSVIRRLANELADGQQRGRVRVVLGHGSGSFGHVAAAEHGLLETSNPRRQAEGIAAVQRDAHDLHHRVTGALREAGARAFSLPPSAWALGREGKVDRLFDAPLLRSLDAGLLPVVFGDVVMGAKGPATICSTEQVLLAVATRLRRCGHRVRRVIWLGVTDGVYDDGGDRIPELTHGAWKSAQRAIGGANAVDVTGGMRLRVETARRFARLGIPSWIVDGREAGILVRTLGRRCDVGTWVPTRPT